MGTNKDFKFDKRAASYDGGFEGRLSKRFYNLLLREVELDRDAAVLDVGCGTGTVLKRMGALFRIDGYGVDSEQNMIAEALVKCPDMKVCVSSCTDMPFENGKFDAVVTCMAFHHFEDQSGFAREAARVLKTDGCLYITDPRFPGFVRKPLNFALRVHKLAGYFGTAGEIERLFSEYGFVPVKSAFDKYAQCVKLRKAA